MSWVVGTLCIQLPLINTFDTIQFQICQLLIRYFNTLSSMLIHVIEPLWSRDKSGILHKSCCKPTCPPLWLVLWNLHLGKWLPSGPRLTRAMIAWRRQIQDVSGMTLGLIVRRLQTYHEGSELDRTGDHTGIMHDNWRGVSTIRHRFECQMQRSYEHINDFKKLLILYPGPV